MHDQQQPRPIAKRSACDRCREHKLRCSRSQGQDDGPCIRCSRAGASCVIGSPRPLGRPRSSTAAPQRHEAKRFRSAFLLPARVPKPAAKAAIASAPGPALPPIGSGSDDYRQFLTAVDPEISSMLFSPHDEPSSQASSAALDTLSLGFDNDTIAPADLVNALDSNSPVMTMEINPNEIQHDRPAPTSLSGLVDINVFNSPSQAVFPMNFLPNSDLDLVPRAPGLSPASTNILGKLARLNDGIASQLSRMKSFAWAVPSVTLIQTCSEKIDRMQENPLIPALQSTSDLACLIKHSISPIRDSGQSPWTTPAVLMCLSGYLQLLQLFNVMFINVYWLLTGLGDVVGFFEAGPSFPYVNGLPPIKGDFYIKMTVQVIEHHVANLEQLLGLPAELSLSRQRPFANSLFSYIGSYELAQTAMTQESNPSETSGRSLVTSLRTNMSKVLRLVSEGG